MSERQTLFEAVGGEQAVTVAVDKLYERAIEDPLLQVYFDSAIVPALKPRIVRYLTFLFDGAPTYEGPTIHQAHVGRDVSDLAFDTFVEALVEAFNQLQVGSAELVEIRRRLDALKNSVVDSFVFPGTLKYEKDRPGGHPRT